MRAQLQLAVELSNLLLLHKPLVGSAGGDNAVFCPEIDHGALGIRSLPAELSQTVMQPNARRARSLKLSLELIDDISVCNRVGDVRGALRIKRTRS